MASLCLRSMADALLRSSLMLSTSTSSSVIPPLSFAPSSASPPPKLTRTLCPEAAGSVLLTRLSQRFPRVRLSARAVVAETDDESKWWKKNSGPNMIDVHSTEEFISALSQAGDRLVIVEFYGTWCGSCRALFPKLCKTAEDHPDILFIKVNFDENKPMCKRLNVRVLPYFHFYRGSDGQLESFSCSLAKFQKIKDAIAKHNTARCSIGPPTAAGNLKELLDAPAPKSK